MELLSLLFFFFFDRSNAALIQDLTLPAPTRMSASLGPFLSTLNSTLITL